MDEILISSCFLKNDHTKEIVPYGSGHINKTYLVNSVRGNTFLLQQINHNIFTDVDSLMRNMERKEYYQMRILTKCSNITLS